MISVIFLLLFKVQIIAAFSLKNKLSINNLTTTSESVDINDTESLKSDQIYSFHNKYSNESIDFHIKTSDHFIDKKLENGHIPNQRTSLNEAIISNERVQNSILKQKTMPQKRSLFGLIIIPCS